MLPQQEGTLLDLQGFGISVRSPHVFLLLLRLDADWQGKKRVSLSA
jgi:hypothetical protein